MATTKMVEGAYLHMMVSFGLFERKKKQKYMSPKIKKSFQFVFNFILVHITKINYTKVVTFCYARYSGGFLKLCEKIVFYAKNSTRLDLLVQLQLFFR
jgi:hypothetical protein